MKKTLSALLCIAMLIPTLASCAARLTPDGETSAEAEISADSDAPRVEIVTEPTAIGDGAYIPASVHGDMPDALSQVSVTAKSSVNGLIAPDTAFTVTSSGDTTADELAKYIALTPQTPYSLTGEGKSYTLTPLSALNANTVYRFTIGGEYTQNSFAFQTESEFFIKSVFPRDLATGVPLNTGIELTFSEPIALEASTLSAFFSVEPSVAGKFMLYPDRKTMAFAPENELDENTVYTVTVKAGIEGSSGRKTTEDKVFAFRTDNFTSTGAYEDWSFSLSQSEMTSPIGQIPRVEYYFYASNTSVQSNITALIYKYPSAPDAINAIKAYLAVKGDYAGKDYLWPSEGLTKIGEYTLTSEAVDGGNYGGASCITLPALDGGIYLCEYTFHADIAGKSVEKTLYQLLTVTNIVTYQECTENEGLLWLNEIGGGVIENARITCETFTNNDSWSTPQSNSSYTKSELVTDKNGIARFAMDDANAALLLIESGDDSRYLGVSRSGTYEGAGYFSFIYTDRELYFSDDTIRLHGVAAPKSSSVKPLEAVTLSISCFNNDFTVPVDKNGAFDFSFDIEQYTGWGINVTVSGEEGEVIAQKYIGVTQEDKPVYRATLEYDKMFYENGDTATLTLTASYFDGTPAPKLTFELYEDIYGSRATLVTDDDGKASYSYVVGKPSWDPYSTVPFMLFASAVLTGLEDTSIHLYAEAGFFHTPVYFRAFREGESGEHTVVTLNKFDTSKITDKYDIYNIELISGEPVTAKVHVSAESYEYIKVSDGTTYNPITKLTTENFHYDTHIKTFESYDATVENGRLVLDNFKRPEDFNGYYRYSIVYTEPSTGLIYTYEVYAVAGSESYYRGDSSFYSLDIADYSLEVGENAEYSCTYGGKPVSGGLLHLVYTAADGKLSEYGVDRDGSFSFKFGEEYIGGCYVSAAYFNGETVELLYTSSPSFDSSSRALNVTLESDAQYYRPGQTATVTVKVSNADGSPVSGTVTAGIVDEACFALGGQSVDPCQSWYGSWQNFYPSRDNGLTFIGTRYYSKYGNGMMYAEEAEAPSANADSAGGMGGGGGDEAVIIREIFADNPYFESVSVENGSAVIVFTVPDNITQWRVTAIAACVDAAKGSAALLGHSESELICTLPLFINAQITDSFVVGDDISATARIAGSAVKSADAASFTAELFKDGSEAPLQTLEASATAGDTYIFRFGKYEAGQYSLTVKATSGEYSDGVKLPFNVTESGMILNISKTVDAQSIKSVKPLLYPVYVSVADGAYSDYISVLDRLMWYKTGRADSLASYYAAITAENLLFGDNGCYDGELESIKSELSAYDGLIPLIEYGEGSIELSAKIAAVVPDALSASAKISLINAFNNVISQRGYDDDIELSAAYLGLAALGEPVLNELGYVYGSVLSDEAMLYIAAAYAYAGDWSAANTVYTNAAIMLKVGDTEAYIDADSSERNVKLTALALLTAVKIDSDNAAKMTRYLMSHTSSVDIYTLEMAAYLRDFYPLGATPAAFTYDIGNGGERVELGAGKSFSITLNKSEFDALDISAVEGEPLIRVFYRGGISDATDGASQADSFGIKKSITVYDAERGLYKVTLDYSVTFDRDFASFTLTDRIPSGARYYGAWQENNTQFDYDGGHLLGFISNDNTQMMHGRVIAWNGSDYGNMINGIQSRTVNGSLSYIIRAATEGEFTIDPAVLQDTTNATYTVSQSGSVLIGDTWTVNLK